MNGPLFLRDLGAYSVQIGLLVAVGAGVPMLLRLRAPAARLMYWHMLLLACIVLPLVRPWSQEVITAPPAISFRTAPAVHYTPSAPVHREFPWSKAALWVLAGGAAARLMWLAAGLWRLRYYRLRSKPFDTAYDANILISPNISSPVTFGARRPVILVPPDFAELSVAMQQGILCHEILHIERRDWLFTMAEELIRAVYWFHPAIWWLLGQIHLAREQAVDRRVIELTEARDPYVDALLAMASARPQLDLAPAPLFLRKRHLKHRVVELLKEAHMSKRRLISGLAVGAVMLAAACWVLTGAIPLTAAPQMVTDGPGVTVNTNGAQLMHRSPIGYPRDAIAKGIQGTVVVQIKLNAEGEVADAAVQTGPEELRKSVIQSVLTWHFTKDAGGSTRTIDIDFALPAAAAPAEGSIHKSLPAATAFSDLHAFAANLKPGRLAAIQITGVSDQVKNELLARIPVHVGDTIGPDQFESVVKVVHEFDWHLGVGFHQDKSSGNINLRIAAPGDALVREAPTPHAAQESSGQRITVPAEAAEANLILRKEPEYPPLAKRAHISGTVVLEAVIGKDGHMQSLHLLSGSPILIPAAMDAAKVWVYKPTLVNGEPVEVATTVSVNFALPD